MGNDLAVRSRLAPPRSEIFESVARPLLNGADRDGAGRTIIGRKMTDPEREVVSARRDECDHALLGGANADIQRVVRDMLSSFNSNDTADQAKIKLGQFVFALQGVPMFAIAQACGRFMRGEVKPEDLGDKFEIVSHTKGPTTAQLRIIASNIAQPYRTDLAAAHALLKAVIERAQPSKEQREKGAQILTEVGEGIRSRMSDIDASESNRRTKARDDLRQLGEKSLLGEYARAGVSPVYSGGMLISLSLQMSRGYTIEEVNGERVLVKPMRSAK